MNSNDKYSKNLLKITSSGSTGEQGMIFRSRISEDISRASIKISSWKDAGKITKMHTGVVQEELNIACFAELK